MTIYPCLNVGEKVIEENGCYARIGIIIKTSPQKHLVTVKYSDGSTKRYSPFGRETGLLRWEKPAEIYTWSQEQENKVRKNKYMYFKD